MKITVAAAGRAPVFVDRDKRLTISGKLSLLYVASVPFDGLDIGERSLPFIVGVVYLSVTIFSRLQRGGRGEKVDLPIGRILPMFLFTLYSMVTYFWSLAPDLTIARVTTLFVLLVTSWFLSQDLSRVGKALPIALVLGCVPVALFVLAAPPSVLEGRRTANGDANDVAMILLFGVACALWMSLNCKGRVRFLGIVSVPILIVGTVATGSRTAILGGAAMLLTIAVWFAWTRRWQRLVILMALVAFGAWIFPLLPAAMVPDRLRSIQEALLGSDLSNRTYIWDAIIARGFDLAGVGAGASRAFTGEALGTAYVSHNVFLGVLLETGILGMLLFLAVLLKASFDGRRSPYKELLIFIVPVLAIGSMALSLEARRSFWLVIAMAWVAGPRGNSGSDDLQ